MRELKEYEKPEGFAVGYYCFDDDDKEKEELESYYAMCIDVGMDKRMLNALMHLNGYNKETLSKIFYYYTGKFIDELSDDDMKEYTEIKGLGSNVKTFSIIQLLLNYKIADMISWINYYLNENLITKAIDEIKKFEINFEADLNRKDNDVILNKTYKLYSLDLNLLCEGINKISNIPDEFKIAFNGIISSFNDKSQYKVPLLK